MFGGDIGICFPPLLVCVLSFLFFFFFFITSDVSCARDRGSCSDGSWNAIATGNRFEHGYRRAAPASRGAEMEQ